MPPTAARRSRLKPFLFAAGGLAVLAIAGLIVAQSQLSPQRLQEALQRAVHRSTGRDLAISGGVHLQLGLAPTFVVEGVSLSNLPGGSQPQMLTAASMKADLALLPLLGGDAVIGALEIDKPEILIERLPDGTPNWQFTAGHRALYQGAGSSGGGSGGDNGRVEIRTISLRDGHLTWRTRAAGQPARDVAFGIDRLDIVDAGDDAPLSLSLTATSGGAPFTLTAQAGSLERLEGGLFSRLAGPWPLTLDLQATGATLHAEGGFTHPDQLRGYQFKVRGTAQDLSAANALAPDLHLPPLKNVTFAATVSDGTQGELRTAQLSLQAGDSDFSSVVPGLQIAHLDVKAPGPGQIAQLAVDGSYGGAPVRVSGTAMQPDVLSASAPIQVTFDAQAAGATASIHGTVPPAQASPGLDLQIALKAPDLSQLSPFAGRQLPAAHDVVFGAHATDAGFRLRGVTLGDLSLASSMGDLSGSLTLGWSPRVAIRGTLASSALDADALWSGVSNGQSLLPAIWPPPAAGGQAVPMPGSQPPPAPGQGDSLLDNSEAATAPTLWSRLAGLTIPTAALRAADIDLALTAANLTAGGQHYRDLDTHLQLTDGKLALNPFRVSSPEGPVVGAASIDASSDTPPVAVTLRSAALAAPVVAGALGYPGGAAGSMQLDSVLSGTGQAWPAIAATLSGHVGLAMVNGDVDNAMVQSLAGAALDAAGAPSLGGGRSQVRCLALRLNLTAGKLRVGTFALDSSRLVLDGTGTADLNARTLDLHLRPQLRLGGAEAAAPVSLTGSFDQPQARLDPVLGGRVGITFGSSSGGDDSDCPAKLAIARGGQEGPMPTPLPETSAKTGLSLKKLPTDLLRGLFH